MKEQKKYNNLREFIHVFNEIELYINYIITYHIEPKNSYFFLNYILNTSIINFAAKLKILINLEEINNKIEIEKIKRYMHNRNSFAHSYINDSFVDSIVNNTDEGVININVEKVFFKTETSGKLTKMYFNDFVIEHKKLQNEIIDIIIKHITDKEINTDHNHVKNLLLYKTED